MDGMIAFRPGEAAARNLANSFRDQVGQFNSHNRLQLAMLRGPYWERSFQANPDSFHPVGHVIARFASADQLWSLRHLSGWAPHTGEKDCFGDETGHVFAARPDASRKLIQASVEAGFIYSNELGNRRKTALDIARSRDAFVANAIWHAINGAEPVPADLNVALKRGGPLPPGQPRLA